MTGDEQLRLTEQIRDDVFASIRENLRIEVEEHPYKDAKYYDRDFEYTVFKIRLLLGDELISEGVIEIEKHQP